MYLEIITFDPSIYKMERPKFIESKQNPLVHKGVGKSDICAIYKVPLAGSSFTFCIMTNSADPDNTDNTTRLFLVYTVGYFISGC